MADISAKIKLEGEAEFRKSLTNITNQSKALESEMKAVESSFKDDTTAQEKAAKKSEVLTKQIDVQKQKVKLLSDMYEKSAAELGENDNKTLKYKDQLNKAQAALNNMEHELDATTKEVDEYGNEIEDTSQKEDTFIAQTKKMEALNKVSEYLEKAAEAMKKLADATIGAAKELDVGYDNIVKKTGATGEAFEEMSDIADDIFGSMPVEMADVGDAIGEVSTRLGLQKDALKSASEQLLKFANLNGVDAVQAIDNVQNMLSAYGMSVEDVDTALDVMNRTGQNTGVHMDNLAAQVVENATAFQEMGMDMYQSIDFMGNLATSGADASSVLSGMKRALKNATQEGIPFNEALANMQDQVLNGTDSMSGLQVAYDLFGKSGAGVYQAVKTGSIDFENLAKSQDILADSTESVAKTYEATLSPWDKTKVAMNNLKTVGSELTGNALSQLVPAIEKVTDVVKKVSDWFDKLSPKTKKVIGVITAVGAAGLYAAPKVLSLVRAFQGFTMARKIAQGVGLLNGAIGAGAAASGADAAAKTTEAVATEGMTVAQWLYNAALEACPIILFTSLAIGAGIAIGELAKYLLEANGVEESFNAKLLTTIEEAEDARKALDNASGSLNDTMEGAKSAGEEAVAMGEVAKNAADELMTLAEKENLSNEEKDRMKLLVDELNTMFPEWGLAIDETTGKLNKSNDEIAAYIDNVMAMAKAQAYQEVYKEIIEGVVEVEKKKIEAEHELEKVEKASAKASESKADAIADEGDAIKKAQAAEEKYYRLLQNGTTSVEELDQAYSDWQIALSNATIAQQNAGDTLVQMADAETSAAVEADKLNKSIAQAEADISAAEEELMAYRQEMEAAGMTEEQINEILGVTSSQVEELGETTSETAGEISEATDEIEASYADLYTKALESVTGAGNAFKEYAENTEYHAADLNAALESQVQAFTDYNENVKRVTTDTRYQSDANFRGIVDSLMAMGIDGAAEMAAFVEAMDSDNDTLSAILANFGDAQTAKEQYAAAMAGFELAEETAMDNITSDIYNSAPETEAAGYEAGTAAGTGYAAGAEDAQGAVSTSTNTLSGLVKTAIGNLGESASQAQKQGKAVVANIALGMVASMPKLVTAITNLQKPIKNLPQTLARLSPSIQTAGSGVVTALANGMTANVGRVTSAAASVASAAKVTLNTSTYSSEGAKVPTGIASGMDSNKGKITSAAGTLKNEIKTNWKSSDFEVLGTRIDQGIAKGMNDSLFIVKIAAKAVAGAAITAAKEKLNTGSPSKEFAYLGEMSVAGYVGGLKSGVGEVARATSRMINLPDAATVSGGRGVSNSYSSSYGDIVVNVNGANVSDPARLADMVADRINRQVLSRKAAFA